MTTHTHPYSIYIWRPGRGPRDKGRWDEPARCFTEEWAIYIANLMHQESQAVIKVVRWGHTFLALPDAHTVELVERQIAREQARPEQERCPFWLKEDGE
jgi:hypothetical protein